MTFGNLQRSVISRVSFSIMKTPSWPSKIAFYFSFSSFVMSFVFLPQYFLIFFNLLFMKSTSFLVLKFAWYSLQKLLITKVTCYILQNSLVTRCRSCSLRKIIRYSLQTLLAACFRGGVTFYNFAKKWLQHRKIFCEFLRKFKNTYSVEHLQTTVSENDIKASINFYSFHLTSINLFTLIWLSLIELLLNCLIKLN